MITKRIEGLQNFLQNGQAVILFGSPNRVYFTGFNSSEGAVLITKNSAYLLVDFRYFEKASAAVRDVRVVLCQRLYLQINEILKGENIKTAFVETESVALARFEALGLALESIEISKDNAAEAFVNKLRSIKSDAELEKIKAAQAITDMAFSYILGRIEKGRSEREIALDLEFFMRKNGADGIAFDTIAISGENTSLPHGVPTERKVQNGDFFTLDFGAQYQGYCSDMTRTVAIGNITEHQRFVYDTVLRAQVESLSKIRAGLVCKDIDSVAREIIHQSGFEGCFGHGLGHSVGLEIHEGPSLNTRDQTVLESGVVMTVEPGIYLENKFGVRIEDMVCVTEDGCINLTKSPKDLIVL